MIFKIQILSGLLFYFKLASTSPSDCPSSAAPIEHGFKIFCSIDVANYEDAKGHFFNGNTLDPFMCTHITLQFAGINDRTYTLWFDQFFTSKTKILANKVKALKDVNPNLRILFSIGGYSDNNDDSKILKYPRLMNSSEHTQTFVTSVLERLRQEVIYDGIEFYYEYPGRHSSEQSDADTERNLYAKFVEKLCTDLRAEKYICAISVVRPFRKIENRQQTADAFHQIMRFADIVILITANIPEIEDEFKNAYHSDMLYPPPYLNYSKYDNNTRYAVAYMTEEFLKIASALDGKDACLREKLLLTIPMQANAYPRNVENLASWQSISSESNIPDPPALGTNVGKGFTSDALVQIPYVHVCFRARLTKYDDSSKLYVRSHFTYADGSKSTPVAYFSDILIPTNDPASVAEKTKYAQVMGLGGVNAFVINYDDSRGWCYNETFPLLRSIYSQAYGNCDVAFNYPASCLPVLPPGYSPRPNFYRPWQSP